jgi:predicted nicotinamide N-methyase
MIFPSLRGSSAIVSRREPRWSGAIPPPFRGDNTLGEKIGGFAAELSTQSIGSDDVALWRVAQLEDHVDRDALLSAENPPEPPYWAHLWSGALLLASIVPRNGGRVLELGCGLGLPGIVAARRGARVTFLDRVPTALAFVRASAAVNRLDDIHLVVADLTAPPLRHRFDLVLAAEVLYDRDAFAPLARALRILLASGGRALLADAGRIDTRAFYAAVVESDLAWSATAHEVREENLPLTVRLVEITRR